MEIYYKISSLENIVGTTVVDGFECLETSILDIEIDSKKGKNVSLNTTCLLTSKLPVVLSKHK